MHSLSSEHQTTDTPQDDSSWLRAPVQRLDKQVQSWALAYQAQLTKPPGSLGQLEQVAVTLAAMQGEMKPRLERIYISVFAADHGVVAEGVSAFPQAVTAQMIRNFSNGGAAVCVLARHCQATFEAVNLGTVSTLEPLPHVVDAVIAPGTANFVSQPAMTEAQLQQAFAAGAAAAQRAHGGGSQLFIGGEMGIGNTTSAAALAAVLLSVPAARVTGAGTGIDAQGMAHKCAVIEAAISHHADQLAQPLPLLRALGGFEIAALAAAYIRAAQLGLAVLVDGFISSVAALLAVRINPDCRDWLLFSHQSAEAGHQHVLEALAAQPLLSIGMRLGEGSGAALVVPLLQAACALHNQMATFEQAAVSSGDD